MAKQTTVTLIDDIDGTQASEQVEFSFEGRTYEIDLSETNSVRLRDALAPFIGAARRSGSGGGARRVAATVPSGRSASDREQNQAIREWAQAQGMAIADRGRIPSTVLEAYHKAH